MKKRAVAFVICLFLIVAFAIVYIFSELFTENELEPVKPVVTDAMKFKEEYEKYNGNKYTKDDIEYTLRELKISEDNPFVYATEDDIVKLMEDGKSFVVYFGFADCPWCRSIIETVIEQAKEQNVTKIYYVNLTGIRDSYSLDNETKELIKSEDGTEGYMKLIDKMSNVLDDYTLSYTTTVKKKDKEVTVEVGEKRIMAPTFVTVKKGVAKIKSTAIPTSLKDSYQELTDEIKTDIKKEIKEVFEEYVGQSLTCSTDNKTC